MRKYAIAAALLVVATASVTLAQTAAAPTVVRTLLKDGDAPGGNTLTMMQVTIPPGGNEGRHISIYF